MSTGYQAVQAGHALAEFLFQYPELSQQWHTVSNYLCYLAVKDEATLEELLSQAQKLNIQVSVFREPDVDNQLTAVCFEPTVESRQLLSRLPLALK